MENGIIYLMLLVFSLGVFLGACCFLLVDHYNSQDFKEWWLEIKHHSKTLFTKAVDKL
jgi:hypothetical protein